MAHKEGDSIGLLNTPQGFDGNVFRNLHLDALGDPQVDVITSGLPLGAATEATVLQATHHLARNPLDVTMHAEASYATCGNTERVSYTVPANRCAYVFGFSTWNNTPAAAFCQWFIELNGAGGFWHVTMTGDDNRQNKMSDPLAWWLQTGDVFKLWNAQQDPANVFMRATVYIREFDAY